MALVVEDVPVTGDPLLAEAVELLGFIKVGQSFLVPMQYASKVRERTKRIIGKKFRTITEGNSLRVGRVS